jgi:thymidylate synthase ThyX
MTANARTWEHAIVKLLSHPLEEANNIGSAIKKESLKITPTLIQFANENVFIKETSLELKKITNQVLVENPEPSNPVQIIDYDHNAENKLVAALLYPFSQLPYSQILKKVETMSQVEKENIVDESLKRRASYDAPLRELEHVYYTFDILMDYGAFRDVQRHRMCTQTNQAVTVIHGYETPEEIIEAGLEEKYRIIMEKAARLYQKIYPIFPDEAQYVVPLGFRKRTLFTWNLRELHHFIAMRSGLKGHISYRRIAQACWQKLNEIHPLLAKYIRVNMEQGSSSWASTMFNPAFNFAPKKKD